MFEGLFQPAHLLVIFFICFVLIIPAIFYILTLEKALSRCSEQSRVTSPSSAWLMLIPLFNLIYHFILVNAVARSLANEFGRRGIVTPEREPGKSIGIPMCVLNLCAVIPILGVLSGLAGMVCWIVYWVKIADYSSMIAFSPATIRMQRPSA